MRLRAGYAMSFEEKKILLRFSVLLLACTPLSSLPMFLKLLLGGSTGTGSSEHLNRQYHVAWGRNCVMTKLLLQPEYQT